MNCRRCGHANDQSAKFCSRCGNPLGEAVVDATPPGGVTPNPTATPLIAEEEFFKAYLGSNNQDYYLSRFKRFDEAGRAGVSWHWPAFFVTIYWLLYRKMWRNALILFLLPIVVLAVIGIAGATLGKGAAPALGMIWIVFALGIWFLPPMFANALYYWHCRKKIAEVKATSRDVQRQLGELAGRGGTSNIVWVILAIVFVPGLGILAAIAIPAYNDYTTKARMVEAVSVGKQAATSVADFYSENEAMPENVAQAGFAGTLPKSVKSIEVDSQTGVITVIMAIPSVADKSVLLVPDVGEDRQITWTCTARDIPLRYLPQECRQSD